MNKTFDEGRDLAISIIQNIGPSDHLVVICPPFIHLNYLSTLTKGIANVKLGAQNCHSEPAGAYTGEISASMLKSTGVEFVIVGHSERRQYFGEVEGTLAKKVDMVLSLHMRPIYCCGEQLDIREAGNHKKVVEEQMVGGLFHLTVEQFSNIIIAYEPVWAIGTGKTASTEQAQEMHHFIRQLIAKKYTKEVAALTTILYGGSCNPSNAKELFSQPDVDGGLIGGASLKADDFVSIFNSF